LKNIITTVVIITDKERQINGNSTDRKDNINRKIFKINILFRTYLWLNPFLIIF
jgi:hypothetical protein